MPDCSRNQATDCTAQNNFERLVNSDINPIVDIARLVSAGVVGGLVATIAAHFLAKSRAKASGIMSEKSKFIPLIDGYIVGTSKGEILGMICNDARHKLFEPAMRFRLHLKGRRLTKFNEIWERFYQTKGADVDIQPNHTEEEQKKKKQTLMSRLEALRKIVSES